MGLVRAEIEIVNSSDISFAEAGVIEPENVRSVKVSALVDSGSVMMAINENVKLQLGLKSRYKRSSLLADGTVKELEVVGPIEVRFGDRLSVTNALVLPGNEEVLLGAIPMEEMDVLIHPNRKKLIPNPAHPNGPQMTLKTLTPLTIEEKYADMIRQRENEDGSELSILNLGPTHPATHGIFQNVLLMDGERIVDAEQTVGYIHRAFEKIAENRPFYQINVLTDRMNYCSSPINNMGWWMTVEKLLNIEVPQRAQYLRVVMMELARIADHLICNSILAVDTGAFTGFLYVMQYREKIYEIYEELCGARLTTNMGRIGGLERDLSDTGFRKLRAFMKDFPVAMKEFEALVSRNRIFMDRCINVGGIDATKAISYGFTGPNLRAAGVDYDIRKINPYSGYSDFDFDVPVGKTGDTYDRYCVRNEEIWQSYRIIQQALDKMPDGPYHADVPDYYLPPKEEVYSSMEALIYHFKIVMGEVPVPKGEVYHAVEGGNGELGFYLISDGSRVPYRLHFRRPCFIYYQAFTEMIKQHLLSDAIVIMSSLNVIAGELDA